MSLVDSTDSCVMLGSYAGFGYGYKSNGKGRGWSLWEQIPMEARASSSSVETQETAEQNQVDRPQPHQIDDHTKMQESDEAIELHRPSCDRQSSSKSELSMFRTARATTDDIPVLPRSPTRAPESSITIENELASVKSRPASLRTFKSVDLPETDHQRLMVVKQNTMSTLSIVLTMISILVRLLPRMRSFNSARTCSLIVD